MRELESTLTRTFLDSEDPASVTVCGDQVWQFWRGMTLLVLIVRMSNPTLTLCSHQVSVEDRLHITWKTEVPSQLATTQWACVFKFEIEGLKKVRHYEVVVEADG